MAHHLIDRPINIARIEYHKTPTESIAHLWYSLPRNRTTLYRKRISESWTIENFVLFILCFVFQLQFTSSKFSENISIEASHKRNLFVHADWNKHKSKKVCVFIGKLTLARADSTIKKKLDLNFLRHTFPTAVNVMVT